MHRLIPFPALLPVFALLVLSQSCQLPPPGSPADTVFRCGNELSKCWPSALPAVNSCLGMQDGKNWVGCLTSLIQPTACGAESLIACLVRDAGSRAHAAASANPGDERSNRMAIRAEEFIRARGYKFAQ